jgi:UDP-N-acetylmuramoylalanine-D-glutamate ligase
MPTNDTCYSRYPQYLQLFSSRNLLLKLFNVSNEKIRESLEDFKNLEHRLEFVATIKGVDFINDSKATNVNSTWYALRVYDQACSINSRWC